MWQYMYETTDKPSMEKLALKMIEVIQEKIVKNGLTKQEL